MRDVPLLPIDEAIAEIVRAYVQHKVMPADPGGDALHLALASFHKCDFLVTWNCRGRVTNDKIVSVTTICWFSNMVLQPDLARVQCNIRESDDEDLLDRVTVYRAGMDSGALSLIEEELWKRGLGPDEIRRHLLSRQNILTHADGVAVMCRYCRKPAVARRWIWHRYWWFPLLPLLPFRYPVCRDHGDEDGDVLT